MEPHGEAGAPVRLGDEQLPQVDERRIRLGLARVGRRQQGGDARRGGGPEDQALYSCMCGYVFTAKVTTSVDCPHCGVEQAW